jgi:hypothetical protein
MAGSPRADSVESSARNIVVVTVTEHTLAKKPKPRETLDAMP